MIGMVADTGPVAVPTLSIDTIGSMADLSGYDPFLGGSAP